MGDDCPVSECYRPDHGRLPGGHKLEDPCLVHYHLVDRVRPHPPDHAQGHGEGAQGAGVRAVERLSSEAEDEQSGAKFFCNEALMCSLTIRGSSFPMHQKIVVRATTTPAT